MANIDELAGTYATAGDDALWTPDADSAKLPG